MCARLQGLRCKTALSRLCYFIHKPALDYPGWVEVGSGKVGCGRRCCLLMLMHQPQYSQYMRSVSVAFVSRTCISLEVWLEKKIQQQSQLIGSEHRAYLKCITANSKLCMHRNMPILSSRPVYVGCIKVKMVYFFLSKTLCLSLCFSLR